MNEEHFIAQLKSGDSQAFKILVIQFGGKVYNTSISILQNAEDAEDLTQEVFAEIFQSVKHFKGESKLSTWIYRIAVSKSLELLRRRNRKKRFGLMQQLFGDDASTSNVFSDFQHPGVQLENKERSKILLAAIKKLPENQKTAFLLHKTEDLSYVEIAEILKVSLSSVESLMFRAKQNLQKLLGDYYRKNEK